MCHSKSACVMGTRKGVKSLRVSEGMCQPYSLLLTPVSVISAAEEGGALPQDTLPLLRAMDMHARLLKRLVNPAALPFITPAPPPSLAPSEPSTPTGRNEPLRMQVSKAGTEPTIRLRAERLNASSWRDARPLDDCATLAVGSVASLHEPKSSLARLRARTSRSPLAVAPAGCLVVSRWGEARRAAA